MKSRLTSLKDARAKKLGWQIIASTIRQEVSAVLSENPALPDTPVFKEAARLSGYSVNMIRRYVQNYEFLNFVKSKYSKLGYQTLSEKPENSISIIRRIYTIDPALGSKGFLALIEEKQTYKELLDRYKTIAQKLDKTSSVRNKGMLLERQLEEFIESNQQIFFGKNNFHSIASTGKRGSHIPRPDFVFTSRKTVERIAFEIKQLHRTRDAHEALLLTAYNSTFYDRYWLVVVDGLDMCKKVCAAVQFAELKNVGVMTIDEANDNEIQVVQKPSGKPLPDRRYLIVEP